MNPLARLAGLAVDRAMGMPGPGVPIVVRRDVGVPMSDGVMLLGDHYRPARELGPLPVVLIRSPYGRAGLAGAVFAAPLARRGFQVFIQSARGTFGSGGQFRPFLHERHDGLATVAWLREQAWCDGRVAMTGASYLGHTQWAIAPYAGSAAGVGLAEHHRRADHLGVLRARRARLEERAQLDRSDRPAGAGRAAARAESSAAGGHAASAAQDAAPGRGPGRGGGAGAVLARLRRSRCPGDDFWAPADHDGADLTRLPPVSMVTGWWDLFVAEQLRDYAAIRAAGVDARLVVGPWLHGEPGEMRAMNRADVAWLRHHLSGGPAPAGPRVRVYLQQAGTWLDFEDWPPAATNVAYYLRPDGALARDARAGDARACLLRVRPGRSDAYRGRAGTPAAGQAGRQRGHRGSG